MAYLFPKANPNYHQKESFNQLFLIEVWGKDDYHSAEKLLSLEMHFTSNEEAEAFAETLKKHFDFPTCTGWVKVHNVAEVLRNGEINSSVAQYIERQQGFSV